MSWFGLDSTWSFADSYLLWLVLFVPLTIFMRLLWRPPAKNFAQFAFVPNLPRSHRQHSRGLPLLLQCLAFVLLVSAMARPQQQQRLPIEEEGIDLLLCIDLSSSMSATDLDDTSAALEITRLDFARNAAAQFIENRPSDRIGLVSFARDAQLICPPTLDHRSLLALLQDLELVPEGREDDATGIGTALARAAVHLRDIPSSSKVVVLLTDGEETVATDPSSSAIKPLEAAALCREWKVRVHAIAAGPNAEQTRSTLQGVATTTGGGAFAAEDAAALDQVYTAIDQLERTRFQRLPWRQVDRFMPFLLAGLFLWLAAAWMNRRFWKVQS